MFFYSIIFCLSSFPFFLRKSSNSLYRRHAPQTSMPLHCIFHRITLQVTNALSDYSDCISWSRDWHYKRHFEMIWFGDNNPQERETVVTLIISSTVLPSFYKARCNYFEVHQAISYSKDSEAIMADLMMIL